MWIKVCNAQSQCLNVALKKRSRSSAVLFKMCGVFGLPLDVASIFETTKCSRQLWTEPLPHTTRIYQNANELLGTVEHLTKLGHGHPKLIVFHPVDASRDAFDHVSG